MKQSFPCGIESRITGTSGGGGIRRPAPVAAPRQSAAIATVSEKVRRSAETPLRRDAQRGVALVITLLMLSIITVVTVAFLALSQRERAAVGQATMQTIAEMATETARERATAQVMARVLNTGAELNLLGPDLFVSLAESNALDQLRPDPWVPVYVTNRASPLGEDRSFLDLNRNRLFDPSGFLPWIDNAGLPVVGAGGAPEVGYFIGDPMWIGVLENPNRPHAADNRFIARYCFVVVPAGRTLDLNYVHNSVLETNLNNNIIGYFRNQGFGTWEMNMAGFLRDLNTNFWTTYQYESDPTRRSFGIAFADARDFLSYRHTLPGESAPSMPKLAIEALPAFALATTTLNFTNDFIDSFGARRPMPLGRYYTTDPDPTIAGWAGQSWAGSGDRQHLFSVHDCFNKPPLTNFQGRLRSASQQTNSYDRYTFYRMLAQVSTDTASAQNPDKDKINLNYQNAYVTNVNGTNIPMMIPDGGTNFVPWSATNFFLITADRLLTNEFQRFSSNDTRFDARIGLLNGRTIPIYDGIRKSPNFHANVPPGPTNPPLYLPRIHQLLQIAANIYEATRRDQGAERYPTVFHPTYMEDTTNNIFITGYEEIDPVKNPQDDLASNVIARAWHDLNDPNGVTLNKANDNIYGIPMIFAAKKGFPNFNEAAVATAVKVSRRIQFRKNDAADRLPSATNVMFTIGISNVIGVEAWNSYSNNAAYPNQLKMTFACRTETRLTNNGTLLSVHTNATNSIQQINGNTWYGGQFMVPPQIYDVAVGNSAMSAAGTLVPLPTNASVFYKYQPGLSNRLHLTLKNKMLFFLEEPGTGRLIDAVALSGMDTEIDLSKELEQSTSGRYWGPDGETTQIIDSQGRPPAGVWNSYSGLQLAAGEVALSGAGLQEFLTTANANASAATIVQAGFTPAERVGQLTKWSVNDPLVHYTLADLQPKGTNESQSIQISGRDYSIALTNSAEFGALLGKINTDAYRPWGVGTASDTDKPALKDPGVRSSQDWEFPEQKLPNVGWLGRIHRGTPWQTIYLKAGDASTDWLYPAGNAWTMTTHPTNDWRLVDFFTTSPNDLAARGRLSVNQTNLAAWSAVFSGIGVAGLYESNTIGSIAMPTDEVFQPASADAKAATAGVAPALAKVVAGINARRAQMPNGMFRTLGEFLSTPELTDASPFLDQPYTDQFSRDRLFSSTESVMTDFEMERIPAQILSLVTVGEPRFVIYAWGQALQPAPYGVRYNANKEVVINAAGHPQIEPSSIITGLGNGLFKFCGNYQVTAEVATRAVLRIDVDPVGMTNNPPVRPRAVIESFNILPNE